MIEYDDKNGPTNLFDFVTKKNLFAVMGNPISHSKSPQVHTLFAEQFGIKLEYRAIRVDVGGFEQAVSSFQASGGGGLNVTIPFKTNAWSYADDLSERAALAGAVNTLVLRNHIYGDNTDGVGLVSDIEKNHQVPIESAKILMIGAGGAAQGVLGPLLGKQPQLVALANRTKDKAMWLAEKFRSTGNINGSGLEELEGQEFDIIINASASSLNKQLPAVPRGVFATAKLAYDMAYGSEVTHFQNWSKECGAKVSVDGLGMLVEQAAEAFYIWHRERPETASVIEKLRSEIS